MTNKRFALDTNILIQLFDSLVIALALEADCEILYTEDMQHGLFVNEKLQIINPYK